MLPSRSAGSAGGGDNPCRQPPGTCTPIARQVRMLLPHVTNPGNSTASVPEGDEHQMTGGGGGGGGGEE